MAFRRFILCRRGIQQDEDSDSDEEKPSEVETIKYMEYQLWLLREMCTDVRIILESEEEMLDNALIGTEEAVDDIEDAKQDITKAIKYQMTHRKTKICSALIFIIALVTALGVLGRKGYLKLKEL